MRTLFGFIVFFLSFSLWAEHQREPIGGNAFKKERPQFEGNSFLSGSRSLTAEEVNSGDWKPSEDGGCDLEKGCPYVNKQGEVRYLPNSEKAKLKKDDTKTAKKGNYIGPIPSNQIRAELKKLQEAGTKKVIIAYGDELTCPFCRELGDSLKRTLSEKEGVALIKVNRVHPNDLPDTTRKIIPQLKVATWDGKNWVDGYKHVGFAPAERTDILTKILE
ncbi:hypothetical protein EBT16_09540 [bacterium]|nr:hypothetical protein [bacterium]